VRAISGPPSVAAAPVPVGDEVTNEATPSYLVDQYGADVIMVSFEAENTAGDFVAGLLLAAKCDTQLNPRRTYHVAEAA
jgi:hypothetical protein